MSHLDLTLYLTFALQAAQVCLGQNNGDSRLFGGKDDAGIVQIFNGSEWTTLCGVNFQDNEAAIICRRHGFTGGRRLPLAAYGEYEDIVAYPGVLQGCPSGQDTHLVNCTFDFNVNCSPVSFAYASVKCFHTLEEPTETIKLDNENAAQPGYFSSISVYRIGTWGQVCYEYWDDADATVACRELGYAGGKASFYERGQNVPYLIGNIECYGNESSLKDCAESESYCYRNRVAGVFCYKTEAPQISLAGGSDRYGKVVLKVDGVEGVLCKFGLTHNTAKVLCRELGYHSGYDLFETYEAPSATTVFLQDVDCTGNERSFWECPNNGWGNVTVQCQNPEDGFSIYCYSEVRLESNIFETKDLHLGRVELWSVFSWFAICAESFTQNAADLVCSEFGYPVAEILNPDAFGRRMASESVNSINCIGTETSLSECNFTIGACPSHPEHANLLCRQKNITSDDQLTLSKSYYGRVYMERYGIKGTVCRNGWDDNDAAVICKMLGYSFGLALGTSTLFARYQPVWITDVACHGNETNLQQCQFSYVTSDTDWGCVTDLIAAGALCYTSPPPDPPVRMVDGVSNEHGRVEIYHDHTGWGTVCDVDWSVLDADVFCRELGFAEGQVHANAFTPNTAQGPVVVSGFKCSGSETSLLQCPNGGWDKYPSSCTDHSRDAGAFCYKHVILTPSTYYGAILIHKGGYKLICADGFEQTAADVVCKELGYSYSLNLCCSALGPQKYDIGVSNVRCMGDEDSVRNCEHEETNPSCPSGNYAAVICSLYPGPFNDLEILQDGKIRLTYFLNEGFVCAEDFTAQDANVICRKKGFNHGYGIKASGHGIEHNIRWLRDLQCQGDENEITDCQNINWGQIGVCDWSMVAGVICTQDEAGLEFEVRLANGSDTAGRVEVKINNEWGTICGNDFTKDEAVVICGQLGYFDGVALAAGHHGGGAGEVTLQGVTCSGTEKTMKDCIWSGYKQRSGLCDHSKDAAVKCYYNLRLTGSTTLNYGRLEVYNNEDSDWLAVCDYGLTINDAIVICRMLGYNTGVHQKKSPLGPTVQPIAISEVACNTPSTCTFKKGECFSGTYVALFCSELAITKENLRVRLPLSSYYGPVEVNRFGLWGAICDVDFDDEDAQVVCNQLNFKSGYALSTFATGGFPTIQGYVNCMGNEASIADCDRARFAEDHGCYDRDTVAGVMCYNDEGVVYTQADIDPKTGFMETRIEIESAGNKLYVALDGFTDVDASVYCLTFGLAGGKIYRTGSGSYGVTRVSCYGDETSFLQCPAVWDPQKTQDSEGALAGVSCFREVSLVGGDFYSHGILYSTRGFDNGPVCAEGFDETDAGVACRNLNFDAGLVLCCSSYGRADDPPIMTDVECSGDENRFTECRHRNLSASESAACMVNYAAVACYSGEKSTDYSVRLARDDSYNGVVLLKYLNIDGRICSDGWDDNDAHVVCKELGFFQGLAYIHLREDVRVSPLNGPYWTSNINCDGTEENLGQCEKTELGMVTECENKHYAGVLCYDREGLYYRLAGSDEARYGRVEVSIREEWRSICDLYWGNNEAHVLCRVLGFRSGEAYHGSYMDTGEGPVWDANFQCAGSEQTLNQCPFSGWEIATSPECATHQNDAGAFCYTSVKLSSGVGRATDKGGVLLYWNDKWNTICSEDFNDTSAKVVCRELGFQDGQAQCCSAYGDLLQYGHIVTHKVKCRGDELDVTSCLEEEVCETQEYASVVCYGFLLTTETVTTQPAEPKFDATPIIIAVVVFIVLVITAAVVTYCVLRRRKQMKLEKSKERFHTRIVSETGDNSIIVQNPMHEMETPEVSRVRYTNTDGTEEASISPAYVNPSYSRVPAETISQEPADVSGIQPLIIREPAQTGSNRTVIQVNSSRYDNLSRDRGVENPYDNISERHQRVESSPYDTIKPSSIEDSHKMEGDFHSAMVEQQHVSSPQASVHEPSWPDT